MPLKGPHGFVDYDNRESQFDWRRKVKRFLILFVLTFLVACSPEGNGPSEGDQRVYKAKRERIAVLETAKGKINMLSQSAERSRLLQEWSEEETLLSIWCEEYEARYNIKSNQAASE